MHRPVLVAACLVRVFCVDITLHHWDTTTTPNTRSQKWSMDSPVVGASNNKAHPPRSPGSSGNLREGDNGGQPKEVGWGREVHSHPLWSGEQSEHLPRWWGDLLEKGGPVLPCLLPTVNRQPTFAVVFHQDPDTKCTKIIFMSLDSHIFESTYILSLYTHFLLPFSIICLPPPIFPV